MFISTVFYCENQGLYLHVQNITCIYLWVFCIKNNVVVFMFTDRWENFGRYLNIVLEIKFYESQKSCCEALGKYCNTKISFHKYRNFPSKYYPLCGIYK